MTYRFPPLERRGLLAGMAPGQALVIVLALGLAVVILDRLPSTGGLVAAASVVAAGAGMAKTSFGSRSLHEWVPVASRFTARAARRRTRFSSTIPTEGRPGLAAPPALRGARRNPAASVDRVRQRLGLSAREAAPRHVRHVQITDVPYRGRKLGVISELGGRRLTAMLACRAQGFSLLDPEAQERRLRGWGLLLEGVAGGPVRRLQWIERTLPAQGDELARWLHAERDPSIPLRGSAMVESYLELISSTARVAHEHEILVTLQVETAKLGRRGGPASIDVLTEQAERLAQGLEAAEVRVLGALPSDQVGRVLRTAFDPFSAAELAAVDAAGGSRAGVSPSQAWPLATRESWDHYACDGALHATYWISGWPRVEVSPMFMEALLGRAGAVRAIAVCFEPQPIERSTRDVEAALTRDRADRELRARLGQLETARQRQVQQAAAQREQELAAGCGEVRFAGFVTVSARSPDELRRAAHEVLEHAARARLELRRLYGQQEEAFTYTLPLCRGLR